MRLPKTFLDEFVCLTNYMITNLFRKENEKYVRVYSSQICF